MTITHTQWQRTLLSIRDGIKRASPYELMFLKSWCFTMMDAIDGPCIKGPDWDTEGDIKASREVARGSVLACDFDFQFTCDCANVNPETISQAFGVGLVSRDDIEGVFKLIKPD